jgi:hypothetical protein
VRTVAWLLAFLAASSSLYMYVIRAVALTYGNEGAREAGLSSLISFGLMAVCLFLAIRPDGRPGARTASLLLLLAIVSAFFIIVTRALETVIVAGIAVVAASAALVVGRRR